VRGAAHAGTRWVNGGARGRADTRAGTATGVHAAEGRGHAPGRDGRVQGPKGHARGGQGATSPGVGTPRGGARAAPLGAGGHAQGARAAPRGGEGAAPWGGELGATAGVGGAVAGRARGHRVVRGPGPPRRGARRRGPQGATR
jgi:hypothetical protein